MRVLIVDDLLRDNRLSETAKTGAAPRSPSARASDAALALENIHNNVKRLVVNPDTRIAHLSEVSEAVEDFRPQAIVLSGTLRDFDFYHPEMLDRFGDFIRSTKTPVLGICGGHQLIGLGFGARIVTLDHMQQHERRDNRIHEYQYRFIRITEPDDPVFDGLMIAIQAFGKIIRLRREYCGSGKITVCSLTAFPTASNCSPLLTFAAIK
ncbi:MAG: hypothetical protein WKF30_13695 [Pyrinomonadaceae bacterium]